jgi:hypothetical protein
MKKAYLKLAQNSEYDQSFPEWICGTTEAYYCTSRKSQTSKIRRENQRTMPMPIAAKDPAHRAEDPAESVSTTNTTSSVDLTKIQGTFSSTMAMTSGTDPFSPFLVSRQVAGLHLFCQSRWDGTTPNPEIEPTSADLD